MFYSTLTTASHTIGLPGVGAAGTRAEPPGCGSGRLRYWVGGDAVGQPARDGGIAGVADSVGEEVGEGGVV